MSDPAARVRFGIMREFVRTGQIDLNRWQTAYPDHVEAITDLAQRLGHGRSDVAGDYGEALFRREYAEVAERVLETPSAGMARRAALDLGRRIARCGGGESTLTSGQRTLARATIFAWSAELAYEEDPVTDRLRVQKNLYMLEQALRPQVFTSFEPHSSGVYDPLLRYADAEPMGGKNSWITVSTAPDGKGDRIRPGPKVKEAARLAEGFLGDPKLALDLIRWTSTIDPWVLAAWTTVHMAGTRLLKRGSAVTVTTVREEIQREPKWRHKSEDPLYSSRAVREAIDTLQALSLLPEPTS
jgi:hypothetical protein